MNKIGDLTKIFDFCDDGGKKYLNQSEIKIAYVAVFGRKPTKYELRDLLAVGMDIEHFDDLRLNFDQFLKIFGGAFDKSDENEDIRNIFTAFDTRCRGFLTEVDLIEAFRRVAPSIQQQAVKSIFRELDSDNDGRISYRDFDFVMKHSLRDQS